MRFHVHVYKVTQKYKIDVEAESEELARGIALANENCAEVEPDCDKIAIAFET